MDPEQLYGVVPTDLRTPYDAREIIARIVDGSRFHEFKELYGTTLVTGFAHIHGHPVGILANNGDPVLRVARSRPRTSSSCATSAASRCCSCRTSPASWSAATTRPAGSPSTAPRWSRPSSTARVPKLTVIVGGSFGAGNYGMCGRAYSPRLLWMWPNARICVMGGEQAATVHDARSASRDRRASCASSTSARATRTTRPPACGTTASSTRATPATSSASRCRRPRNAPLDDVRYGVFRM